MIYLMEQDNWNILIRISMLEALSKVVEKDKLNTFTAKALFFQEFGWMMQKLKGNLPFLMEISLKDNLKITWDIMEYITTKMEMYLKDFGKMTSKQGMES